MIFIRAETTKDGTPVLEVSYEGPRGGKRKKTFPVLDVDWDADSYPLKDFFRDRDLSMVMCSSSCDFPEEEGWDMKKVKLWPREMISRATNPYTKRCFAAVVLLSHCLDGVGRILLERRYPEDLVMALASTCAQYIDENVDASPELEEALQSFKEVQDA